MADWGAALIVRLTEAGSDLAALVGPRVDFGAAPDEQAVKHGDYVVLRTISDPRPDHFGGAQGLRQTRVQADCYSVASADRAAKVAEAVIARVRPEPDQDGADGSGSWSAGGVRFDRPQIDGPEDSGEQLETVYVHRSRVDLLLWHCEEEG